MTHQTPCIPEEYCFPQLCRLYCVKYFSKKFLRENFWKTNVKAHPWPFRPGPHLYQTRLQHSTYINGKYSSGDWTMFDSILTVFVVIYAIVLWKYCSKRTTSMSNLTTFEYWWICISRQIILNEYYDIRWYEISWTIVSYGPGPCITNVFATCRKNFSQWHRSFQRKLRSHWPKILRHVAITLVIQAPVLS